MEFAISAARWVVGKALSLVTDGLLETWASSRNLCLNFDDLKTELLCAQGMLDHAQGREIRSPALKELLQNLQQLAYNADDVLDELDYFRIQDDLYSTFDAADSDPRGFVQNLLLHARHTATAVVAQAAAPLYSQPPQIASSPDGPERPEQGEEKQAVLCYAWRRARQRARSSGCSLPHANQPGVEIGGGSREVASSTRTTVRPIGKFFPCCFLPTVQAEVDSGDGILVDTVAQPPQQESVVVSPAAKLEIYRTDMSNRMKGIVEELRLLRANVLVILDLELKDSVLRTAQKTEANLSAIHLKEEGLTPLLPKSDVKTRTISTSYISESKVYGREEEKNKIICSVTEGAYSVKHLTVLPIFGLGGMGKTTFAKYIYKELEKHFEVNVWICVSVNFSVTRLLKELVDNIPPIKDEKYGPPEMLIEQRLKSKRFLLVLDDMWDSGRIDDWNRLLAPLTRGQTMGNMVIVTTRSPGLAQTIKTTDNAVRLKGLGGDEFDKLFRSCVFGDDDQSNNVHRKLYVIGEKIKEKLKGCPLAAKTVGKLLRNNLDQNHWKRVLESNEWQLETGDDDIMPALKLSYDFLPIHLQCCFSFCALFPQDYEFDSKELIYWWIGLDLLQSSHRNSSIEEIGQSNIDDLVARGFIEEGKKKGCPCYTIHDLLHDLGLKVASRECLSIDRSNVRSIQIWPSVRHLSIIINTNDSDGITDDHFITEMTKLKALKIENLQSLMIFGQLGKCFSDFFGDLIKGAKTLRVLHLSRMSSHVGSILQNISAIHHLRYLSLPKIGDSGIHLPNMLSRFYHLKILDLQAWTGHLDLPAEMSNLRKLCHFLTPDDEAHSDICNVEKLQLLQELKIFRVNKKGEGFELKQLGDLTELRELGIYNLEKVQKKEATEAKLINKNYLRKLTLEWCTEQPENRGDVEGEVLEELRPHKNLQELCINGHGSRSCPTWLGGKLSVEALQSLHVESVNWEDITSLRHMGALSELTLKHMSALKEFGPRHFGVITETSFCSLTKLILIGLEGLEKWVLGDRCCLLFQLEVLIIKDCPRLLGLPFVDTIYYPPRQDHEGKVHWFPNLQELEIEKCPKVVSFPPIPWTQTLCSIKIKEVGSSVINSMEYTKSSSNVKLQISGNHVRHTLDEKVLIFNYLTDLRVLRLWSNCFLESKHLRMLTSLKDLSLLGSGLLFAQSGNESEVQWQLPIETLLINGCNATGKELTQFLSHLPKLSDVAIFNCTKITQMGVAVAVEQQQPAAHAPSAARMEDAQVTCHQQQKTEEVEEIKKVDDGLLIIPAHLSNSLRSLDLGPRSDAYAYGRPEWSLVFSPFLRDSSRAGRGGKGGWLHGLSSLRTISVLNCPKFFSAYNKTPVSSPSFLFPSSLEELSLWNTPGLRTLEPLANLVSLTQLDLYRCGKDLRSDGLWTLVTQGQLSKLTIRICPGFFIGSNPIQGMKDDEQVQLLRRSCKLQELDTDVTTGFLTAPICTILSDSLTKLRLDGQYREELSCFTKEQEEALQLLTSLEILEFQSFPKLQCLPAGLRTLSKLERLTIWICKLIRSLPSDGLPRSLRELNVGYCNEELQQQCREFVKDHPEIELRI